MSRLIDSFGTTVLVRDLRGLVTQATDPRGIVSNLAYDNAGWLLTVSYPSSAADNVTYGYDATAGGNKGVGRLTGITDKSGSTSRVYDALGRIASETRVIAGRSYATAYAYDAASHLTQVTYPSGRIVTYARNSLGQVTGVTTKQTAAAAVATVATGIGWMPMSNLIAGFTQGNGLITTAGYDQDYRLNSLAVANGASNVVSLGYAYADKLNLTAVNDNITAANSVGLGYTPANRLATATGPWGTASYSYDGTGNRLTETVTSGATTSRVLSYPASSNLLSGITENGAALRTYGYDAAGNITTDTRPGEAYAFTYNVRNRPVSVTRNSAAWATYAYNALEQMVSRSTSAPGGPTGTVHYVYDLSGHLIAEADGATGATLREYIWLAANDNGGTQELPLATVTNVNTTPVLYMVHADHLGRPIRMTDASKATVWQAVYKPFGEVQATSGTIANDLRFPGQFFLIETGLAYNWHRHYDPLTGRYTQPDPLRFVDGPSVFAYAGGSPATNIDPFGLANPQGWPTSYPNLPLSDEKMSNMSTDDLRDMYQRLRNAGENAEADKVKRLQKYLDLRNKGKQRGLPKMRLWWEFEFVPPLCLLDPGLPGCPNPDLASYKIHERSASCDNSEIDSSIMQSAMQ